jgi:hypothetical protein
VVISLLFHTSCRFFRYLVLFNSCNMTVFVKVAQKFQWPAKKNVVSEGRLLPFKSRCENDKTQDFSTFAYAHCHVSSFAPYCDGRTRILNHLKTKHVCFIQELSPYRAVNTPPRLYNPSLSILYKVQWLFVQRSLQNTQIQSKHRVEYLVLNLVVRKETTRL